MKTSVELIYYVISSIMITLSAIVSIIALYASNRSLKKQLKQSNESLLKQLKQNSDLQIKQSQETFFAEYTKRYQDIILHLPDNEKNIQWIKYVRLYFDLCSEEYHLHEIGLINEKVWQLWVDGMRDDVKRQSFRNAWIHPLGQNYNDKGFVNFMNHEIINKITN